MSKLIVEMELPKQCIDCCVRLDCELYMNEVMKPFGKRDFTAFKPLSNGCLIRGVLPEEHGDLVDADTVLWEVPDSEGIVPPMPVTIGDVIEGYDVPIVIAAERKDDGN